ncbi:hypothetical protein EV360DRAFT_72599 [Lentinula raphanica]|nr:hypothetical protein EV360DRAFT_72599 [Lentinula raphanica]
MFNADSLQKLKYSTAISTATMTRTPSRTLAILLLGAAISSSVLAAPTSLQPLHVMSDSPVPTGAQPLHPRSVGQTSEVATFQRRQEDVNLKSPLRVGGDLTIDDPKYNLEGKDGRDSPDNNRFRAVPVNLNRRNNYQARTKEDIQQVQAAWTRKSDAQIVADVHRNRATLNEWFTEYENLNKDQPNRADYQGRRLTLADRFINTGAVFTLYEDMIGACGQLARTELPGGGDWKKEVRDDARKFLRLAQLLTQDRIPGEETYGTSERLVMYKNVLKQTINNPLPVKVSENGKKDEVLSDMVGSGFALARGQPNRPADGSLVVELVNAFFARAGQRFRGRLLVVAWACAAKKSRKNTYGYNTDWEEWMNETITVYTYLSFFITTACNVNNVC